MKTLASFALIATFVTLAGCGPDSELVASGRAHTCDIQALQAQIEANPGDAELQEQLADKLSYLESVIQSAGEGDRAELETAIQAAAAEGCD